MVYWFPLTYHVILNYQWRCKLKEMQLIKNHDFRHSQVININ